MASSTRCLQSTRLTNLPLDTFIHVLSFVTPQDLFSVRKTCKQLLAASCQRIVWINALRHICSQRGVFINTFPIKDMTLSQLEHATTTPSRFTALLRTPRTQGAAQSIATRVLRSWHPNNEQAGISNFESLYLVPGGRFLLTRTSGNLLQLWDLGFSPDMLIRPESLASHFLGSGDLQFDPDAQVTRDGEGLLVFFASENVFRIFEIYPLSPSPTFRQIARIEVVLKSRCVYIFTPELVVFAMDRRVYVWNYIHNTSISWGVRSNRVWDIAVSESHVILLDLAEFSVYKIPPLQARDRVTDVAVAASQTPLMCLPYPISEVIKIADNSSWYTQISESRPVHFDILGFHETDDNKCVLARYTLKHVNNDPDDGLPAYIPVLVEQSELDEMSETSILTARSIRSGSGDMFLVWSSGTKLFTHFSTLNDTQTPVPNHQSAVLGISAALEGEVACCPISGRVCVIYEHGNIHVMDYIMPPGR